MDFFLYLESHIYMLYHLSHLWFTWTEILDSCVINLQMKSLGKEEFIHMLRRQSTGFARGSSKYRGVTLHKCGKWDARMGQFHGKK